MAVPIEFCSVVVRKDLAALSFPRGLDELFEVCDSGAYLEDAHLARVAFMSTEGACELAERILARLANEPSSGVAIVDHSTSAADLPAWLELGDIAGHRCVWLASAPAGPVAVAPSSFLARFLRVDLSALTEQLTRRGVVVAAPPAAPSELELRRGQTRVVVIVAVDDDGHILGLMTHPPRAREPDLRAHDALIADLDASLQALGWKGGA
jgi:hypothetical protein